MHRHGEQFTPSARPYFPYLSRFLKNEVRETMTRERGERERADDEKMTSLSCTLHFDTLILGIYL